MSLGIFDERVPIAAQYSIVAGDGTTVKTVLTARGPAGARIDSISFRSGSASAHTVYVYYQRSSTNYLIGAISVPANQGYPGAPLYLEASDQPAGPAGWLLQSGDLVTAQLAAAVTGGEWLSVTLVGGDF